MLDTLLKVANKSYTSMPHSEKNTFPPTSTNRLYNFGLPARISSLKPPPRLPLLRSMHGEVLSRVQDDEMPPPSVRLANSIFSEHTKKAAMLVHVVKINSAWRVFPRYVISACKVLKLCDFTIKMISRKRNLIQFMPICNIG